MVAPAPRRRSSNRVPMSIARQQSVDEQAEERLDDVQRAPLRHRARGVDDERQGGVGSGGLTDIPAADADRTSRYRSSRTKGVEPPSTQTPKVPSAGAG